MSYTRLTIGMGWPSPIFVNGILRSRPAMLAREYGHGLG